MASEPPDEDVNAAIDALAAKAKRGIYGTTGHAWDARAEVDRLANRLKRMLNTPPEADASRGKTPAVDETATAVSEDEAFIDKGWETLKAADVAAKGSPRDIIRTALDPFREGDA